MKNSSFSTLDHDHGPECSRDVRPSERLRVLGLRLVIASLLLGCLVAEARADEAADFVVKLFSSACVPNMGLPDKVRAWASAQHLQPITAPAALAVFVGPGDRGGAWAVAAHAGRFALSIRGQTQGCAVWARAADPEQVETLFRTLVEGVKRPGIDIRVDQDKTVATPNGAVRSLAYTVFAPGASTSFVFLMTTAEKPGGAFQASMQVAKAKGTGGSH